MGAHLKSSLSLILWWVWKDELLPLEVQPWPSDTCVSHLWLWTVPEPGQDLLGFSG